MRYAGIVGLVIVLLFAGCSPNSDAANDAPWTDVSKHSPDSDSADDAQGSELSEQQSIYIGVIESIVDAFAFTYSDFQGIALDWQVPTVEISSEDQDMLRTYFLDNHNCEIIFASMQQTASTDDVLFMSITDMEPRGSYERHVTGYLNETGRPGELVGIQVLLTKQDDKWHLVEAGGTWVS